MDVSDWSVPALETVDGSRPNPWRRLAMMLQENRPVAGQVMVTAALMVSVFFGMLAMAVDIGFGLAQRRSSQNAADAAAMAAARILAKSVDVATDGGVVFIDATDSIVWGIASPYFTANRVGGPLSPSFTTALEYLDCAKASLGFSNSSATSLVGAGTKLGSGSVVPRTTCYVRAISQIQFGTFFG